MALSSADRSKLAAILGMLGSSFPHERASAALLADRFVRDHDATWAEVVQPANAPPPRWSEPPQRCWRDVANDCLAQEFGLTPRRVDFLQSILQRDRGLSARQADWLRDIAASVGVEPW